MAAAIQEQKGVDSELIGGANGVFDVVVDGELIFSKHREGRFPVPDEVLSHLAAR